MIVKHKETNFILGKDIKLATSFKSKLIGLMFVKEMKGMDGLILDPCQSVHNCFVRFPTDVIFLTSENKIIKIIRSFKPWRFTRIYFTSRRVLELPENTIPDNVFEGDFLEVSGV